VGLGDVALACCTLLVDELALGGVRHACVSPGSRSTPIALALWRHPDIAVQVHLDERSSAFVALGIAKATGSPVAVACTSGTAAAELLPAVVEASQARVPLVLLTADRPPHLRGTGANQTIVQPGIFGGYVRREFETPLPEEGLANEWRQIGMEAAGDARTVPHGPVYVNLPFDEPLVPDGTDAGTPDPAVRLDLRVDVDVGSFVESSSEDVTRIGELFEEVERGVLVAGPSPAPATAFAGVAVDAGWPIIAEPLSGSRGSKALAAGQSLIGDPGFVAAHTPELVVQIGALPTMRATQAFVASASRLAVIDDHHLEPDPEGRADLRVRADPEEVAAALHPLGGLPSRPASEWFDRWRVADGSSRIVFDRFLDGVEEPFEPRIARDVARWTPEGTTLFVGSSTPVRDLDLAMAPRDGLRVLANRGASGIDGLVSTSVGVAAAGPTVALLGDLSFLYDAGALLWAAGRPTPDLVVAVIRNGGGEVFSLLPQHELPEHRELFTTPHDLDLEGLCTAARCGWSRVDRATDLLPALDEARRQGGIAVVEVVVDPERGLDLRRELRDAIAVALA
jgi:2-succinyl-5-enolpyruvyl-6-hydroxy-3-cyclohexene-1-carboxylate synthase